MNKEQFKKSILEVMNYHIGQMIGLNLAAKEAQDTDNKIVLSMVQTEAEAASFAFTQGLEELINQVFPEEDSVELPQGISEEDVTYVGEANVEAYEC